MAARIMKQAVNEDIIEDDEQIMELSQIADKSRFETNDKSHFKKGKNDRHCRSDQTRHSIVRNYTGLVKRGFMTKREYRFITDYFLCPSHDQAIKAAREGINCYWTINHEKLMNELIKSNETTINVEVYLRKIKPELPMGCAFVEIESSHVESIPRFNISYSQFADPHIIEFVQPQAQPKPQVSEKIGNTSPTLSTSESLSSFISGKPRIYHDLDLICELVDETYDEQSKCIDHFDGFM
jgi:hypothetical protein